MSCSAAELVRITTGMRLRSGSCLISARTSRPSLRGKFRSSRTRSGRGKPTNRPSRRRRDMASTPSWATCSWWRTFAPRGASTASRTSPGLSSTNKICIGLPSSASCMAVRLPRRQCERERASLARFGLHPDAAGMVLHDLLGDRQTDAGAGIPAATVQALKDQEDALDVLRLDADAVVPQPEKPILPPTLRPNVDEDRLLAAELDSVAEQILEELYQLCLIGHDGRQGVGDDHGPALLNGRTQVHTYRPDHRGAIGGRKTLSPSPDARVAQQIVNQPLHTGGAIDDIADKLSGIGVEVYLFQLSEISPAS